MKFNLVIEKMVGANNFVTLASRQDFDINVDCGSRVIDGKSMLGMFALSFPVSASIECVTEDSNAVSKFKELISQEEGLTIKS